MSDLERLHQELSTDEEYRRAYAEEELIHRVAERVYKLRKRRGWSQSELAARLDTQQPAIARLEGGFDNLTLRRVAALAYALECEPEDLVSRGVGTSSEWWSGGFEGDYTIVFDQAEVLVSTTESPLEPAPISSLTPAA